MRNAIMLFNLICCIQLSAQSDEIQPEESYDLDIAYNVAQRHYNLGVTQSKLANKWGIATSVLSGISLIGYATTDKQSSAHSLSYWGSMASMGAATVGLVIKLSSIEKVGSARAKMNQIDYDRYSGFGYLEIGAADNGIGFTYTF